VNRWQWRKRHFTFEQNPIRLNLMPALEPLVALPNHPVTLVYLEETEQAYQVETVDTVRVGPGYRISSIPFFAKHVALHDVVSVETDEGVHYFEELLVKSGHSVVRVLFGAESTRQTGTAAVEQLGAVGFRYANSLLVAFDIPPSVAYPPIQHVLANGESQKLWEYEEACLGWK
jgi:hypothetical protein